MTVFKLVELSRTGNLTGSLPVMRETDVLVFAGDIREGSRAIDLYGDCFVLVVYRETA